jgi:hypothetical protein
VGMMTALQPAEGMSRGPDDVAPNSAALQGMSRKCCTRLSWKPHSPIAAHGRCEKLHCYLQLVVFHAVWVVQVWLGTQVDLLGDESPWQPLTKWLGIAVRTNTQLSAT